MIPYLLLDLVVFYPLQSAANDAREIASDTLRVDLDRTTLGVCRYRIIIECCVFGFP